MDIVRVVKIWKYVLLLWIPLVTMCCSEKGDNFWTSFSKSQRWMITIHDSETTHSGRQEQQRTCGLLPVV